MKTNISRKESMDILSKKGTCIEFFSAYQDLDIDRMLNLCHEDGTTSFEPLGDEYKGTIYELGKNMWMSLMDCFPDIDNTVKEMTYNEKDSTVTCTVSIFGTQAKDFAGVICKDNDFETEHIFIFRFQENDLIDHISISWDMEAFVKQLSRD
ncbi:MAG: nuclear transport factor 2 family protein [Cyclobacteriaceae bacterium]|nr:nuclear transport factor 2 family protein [Cyclobacteriaceae bacterium]